MAPAVSSAALLQQVRRLLEVEDSWAEPLPEGFRWWPWRQAQEVTDRDGWLRVSTDVLLVPSLPDPAVEWLFEKSRDATLAALSLFPAAGGEGSILRYVSALRAGGPDALSTAFLAATAAILQAQHALRPRPRPPSGLRMYAESPHPESGFRPVPDDLLLVVPAVFQPAGEGTSPWWSEREFLKAAARLSRHGRVHATGPFRLESRLGRRSRGEVERPLVVLTATESHPWLGIGLTGRVTLPRPFRDPVEAMRVALDLNVLEAREPLADLVLGTWTIEATEWEDAFQPVFTTFLPNVAFRSGLLGRLAQSLAERGERAPDALREAGS